MEIEESDGIFRVELSGAVETSDFGFELDKMREEGTSIDTNFVDCVV